MALKTASLVIHARLLQDSFNIFEKNQMDRQGCQNIITFCQVLYFFSEQADKSYMLTILTVFGGRGYKNNVKTSKQIQQHVFHANIYVYDNE